MLNYLRASAVKDVGPRQGNHQQTTVRIDNDVPLAANHLRRGVVARSTSAFTRDSQAAQAVSQESLASINSAGSQFAAGRTKFELAKLAKNKLPNAGGGGARRKPVAPSVVPSHD